MVANYVLLISLAISSDDIEFTFHGFQSANLTLDGVAKVTSNGLLQLTNNSVQSQIGHCFYPIPINFKNSSKNGSVSSFSTCFVFAIVPQYPKLSGHGLAFVMAPTRGLPGAVGAPYLGLFNETNNGNETNRIVAVELDTISNNLFRDINDNHVGIDINDLRSVSSFPAGYYDDKDGIFHNSTLISGQPIQLWIEYNSAEMQINVTLAPLGYRKPHIPLLSLPYDLSKILKEIMYVGFSSATGSAPTSHYVLGWSFKMNGIAQELDFSKLPKLPRIGAKKVSDFLKIGLPQICIVSLLVAIGGISWYIIRKRRFAEVLEEWEIDYGTQRFKYKDLYSATKGFKEKQLLGSGGFGRVYKGILPNNKIEVAIKKISHESRQGMREFVAEIVSMGRLRHRNLVPLLGYCRRKGELLLVYEYMPNGSLDKFLHPQPAFTLNWNQRIKIIKGVASALLYLHEEWEQIVIHRDVKASNVLLDGELNGRLGDFGLARLYDHGSAPQSTRVVGTLGYLAPEHNITGKATTSTDVFAFGAFLLEVACGRRPIEPRPSSEEEMILIHWVFSCWKKGEILGAIDQKLGYDFVKEEAELVLKLGLLCSHSEPTVRPSVRQIMLYLEGSVPLPELSSFGISAVGIAFATPTNFPSSSFPFAKEAGSSHSSFIADSLLSGGR